MSQSPEEALEAVRLYVEEHGCLPPPPAQWSADLTLNAPKMLEAGNWDILETSPYRVPPVESKNIFPEMTSDTTPPPWKASASSSYFGTYPHSITVQDSSILWHSVGACPQYVDLSCDGEYYLDYFEIFARSDAPTTPWSPKNFDIYGYPIGSSVPTLLASYTNVFIPTYGKQRFEIPPDKRMQPFSVFRITILAVSTETGAASGSYACIGTLNYYGRKA